MKKNVVFLLALSMSILWHVRASASPVTYLGPIDNPSPEASFFFGWSFVEMNENLLVGASTGGAFVIDLPSGNSMLHITSPEREGREISFGDEVGYVGSLIAISDSNATFNANNFEGAVYLFDDATGAYQRTLRSPTPTNSYRFGHATEGVAGHLYVSDASVSTAEAGVVHVYDPTNGTLVRTLRNPEVGTEFGFTMQEYDGDVFISARGNGTEKQGIVYRYGNKSDVPNLTIAMPASGGPTEFAQFGSSLAVSGDRLLVGAPAHSLGPGRVGQAFLYNADSGELLLTIVNPEPHELEKFGVSVAMTEDWLFVGSSYADASEGIPSLVGGFYVFDAHTGAFVDKILNPDLQITGRLTDGEGKGGLRVVGDQLLASSVFYSNQPSSSAGRLYTFSVPEPSAIASLGIAIAVLWRRTKRRPRKNQKGASIWQPTC